MFKEFIASDSLIGPLGGVSKHKSMIQNNCYPFDLIKYIFVSKVTFTFNAESSLFFITKAKKIDKCLLCPFNNFPFILMY